MQDFSFELWSRPSGGTSPCHFRSSRPRSRLADILGPVYGSAGRVEGTVLWIVTDGMQQFSVSRQQSGAVYLDFIDLLAQTELYGIPMDRRQLLGFLIRCSSQRGQSNLVGELKIRNANEAMKSRAVSRPAAGRSVNPVFLRKISLISCSCGMRFLTKIYSSSSFLNTVTYSAQAYLDISSLFSISM